MQSYTKKRKKGFTLTELAIVIAVIAILIAVLVPTFTSLINKANTSADEQAVKNMNTALSIHEANEDFDTISDVVNALAEDNYDLENYTPLISGMQFYWVKEYNRIVYADAETYEISYPSEYTSLKYSAKDGWYSLNGNIKLDNTWTSKISDGTVTISSGAQLASLMTDFSSYSSNISTITLTGNIDLMGASVNFGTLTSNLTITCSSGTCTIYGFRNDTNSFFGQGEFAEKGYGYGLFAKISVGTTVKISNVNFSGMVVNDTLKDNGTMALIAGYCHGTLEMEKVTFTDCYVKGKQKVSTIAAQLDNSGSITLKDVDFVDTTVAATVEGAKVIAYVYGNDTNPNCNFSYDSACDFSGITVIANDDVASYFKSVGYVGSVTVTYTTTLGNTYECIIANFTGKSEWGNAMVVATDALYLYQAFTNQTVGNYTLRDTNTPGDAQISGGTLQTTSD